MRKGMTMVAAAVCALVVSGCVGQTAVQRTYESSLYYSILAKTAGEYSKLPTADAKVVRTMANINAQGIDANKQAEAALQLCLDEKIIQLRLDGFEGDIEEVRCENAEAAMIGAQTALNRLRAELQAELAREAVTAK